MRLRVVGRRYAVCRLAPEDPLPESPTGRGCLTAVVRTPKELSLVCPEDEAPPHALVEAPWTVLEVRGPLDFAQIGILARLTAAIAAADISVFAISTFDTDYLLVPERSETDAVQALRDAGHDVKVPG